MSHEICLVTAFGRGETLATALREAGAEVTTLDFTEAFGPEFARDIGPFPVPLNDHLPVQRRWLDDMRELPGGLSFWLDGGPIELSGPMAAHYAGSQPAIKTLLAQRASADFGDDWLRRFNDQFASPFYNETWENPRPARFPFEQRLGIPPGHRESVMLANSDALQCEAIEDMQLASSRLLEIAVRAGQTTALRAERWVWCLSSRETEILNPSLAPKIFPRGIYRPEWSWVSFEVTCEHGPWLDGLPEHVFVLDDVFLPWTHANLVILRRRPGDLFQAWVRLPVDRVVEPAEREDVGSAIAKLLQRRLDLARWRVRADAWNVCPHTPVFGGKARDLGAAPPWKNWDWIAPDNLPRLDWGARLEREAQTFRRLETWRRDRSKKRGALSDLALHAP